MTLQHFIEIGLQYTLIGVAIMVSLLSLIKLFRLLKGEV